MYHCSELGPIREVNIDESSFNMDLWLLDRAKSHPHVFKLLPININGINDPGAWVHYPYDDQLQIWVNSSHPEGLEFFSQYKIRRRETLMSSALTVQEKSTVLKLLSGNMKAVASVAPKHLTPERLMRIAYQAIVKTPKLATCSQLSLVNAVIEAAQLGLEISGPLGQASIVPFGNEANLIVEYKGKIALAYNSGMVESFQAHPVYQKDVWDYQYGINPYLKHRPYDGDDDRGSLIAAYAVTKFKNGGYDFEVVNKKAAMRAKQASKAKNSDDSPWNQPENEWTMWVKTAVHQLSKRIPQSPELQRANMLDDRAERGEKQDIGHIIDIELSEMPQGLGGEADKTESVTRSTATSDDPAMANLKIAQEEFPDFYEKAIDELGLVGKENITPADAKDICTKINETMDREAAG